MPEPRSKAFDDLLVELRKLGEVAQKCVWLTPEHYEPYRPRVQELIEKIHDLERDLAEEWLAHGEPPRDSQ